MWLPRNMHLTKEQIGLILIAGVILIALACCFWPIEDDSDLEEE